MVLKGDGKVLAGVDAAGVVRMSWESWGVTLVDDER